LSNRRAVTPLLMALLHHEGSNLALSYKQKNTVDGTAWSCVFNIPFRLKYDIT